MSFMAFKAFIEQKFVQWQNEQRQRKTIADFASFLGVSQPLLSMWMNGSKKPGPENIKILSERYGLEIYDLLGKDRPDPDLHFIQKHWNELSPTARRKLRDQVVKDAENNSKKKK